MMYFDDDPMEGGEPQVEWDVMDNGREAWWTAMNPSSTRKNWNNLDWYICKWAPFPC